MQQGAGCGGFGRLVLIVQAGLEVRHNGSITDVPQRTKRHDPGTRERIRRKTR